MQPLIIDIGSYAIKLGFGGEYAPRLDIPLVVGKIRDDIDFIMKKRIFKELRLSDKVKQEYFFGHEAVYLRNFVDMNWIYNGRTIVDEFFFNKVIEHSMDLLKVTLRNQPVLISQPFYSNVVEHVGRILFSNYNAIEIIPAFQPLLNFLAGGIKTGLMVDIGHHLTQITPMVNGVIVTDGVQVLDIGGKDITELLLNLLLERKAFDEVNQSAILSPMAIAETIKELYCYVSRNPADELDLAKQKPSNISFPLLFNEKIQVGVERFLAPEMLFIHQKENVEPLQEAISKVVSKFDPPVQQAFLGNILLTGGTSLLPGFAERLHDELVREFIDYDYKIKIYSFSEFGSPRYSTFFGAAKLTAQSVDKSLGVSRTDYEYKGSLEIPLTFMEQFSTIFEQVAPIKLKPIIISVKNFFNSQLMQFLYNLINSQRELSLVELGNVLQRSPVELYQAIETLLAYNIIEGELTGFQFVNTQYREEVEEEPSIQVKPSMPVQGQKVHRQPAEEESYVPTFQRLDTEMPDQVQPKVQSEESPEELQYEYTFQKIDAEMQEKWAKDPTVLVEKTGRGARAEILEDAEGTFKRIDAMKAEEYAKDPIIITEKKHVMKRTVIEPIEGFTFEKIDQEMAEKWAKDETIVTEDKKPKPAELLLPPVDEPTYVRADKEQEKEWKESGVVSIPKKVIPKGFFEQHTQVRQDEELLEVPTFLQIKEQEIPQSKKVMIEDLLKPKETVETSTPIKSTLPTFLQMGGGELTEEQLRQIKEFEEEERRKKEKEEKLL